MSIMELCKTLQKILNKKGYIPTMKRFISILLATVSVLACFTLNSFAAEKMEIYTAPDISVLSADEVSISAETRASGLILAYGLSISKSGTTLRIVGETTCAPAVVKCGFKDLTVERRKTTSDSWSTYYEYGDVYIDMSSYTISTSLTVPSGYYYRVTCTHYAKKHILSTQKVDNETNGIYF